MPNHEQFVPIEALEDVADFDQVLTGVGIDVVEPDETGPTNLDIFAAYAGVANTSSSITAEPSDLHAETAMQLRADAIPVFDSVEAFDQDIRTLREKHRLTFRALDTLAGFGGLLHGLIHPFEHLFTGAHLAVPGVAGSHDDEHNQHTTASALRKRHALQHTAPKHSGARQRAAVKPHASRRGSQGSGLFGPINSKGIQYLFEPQFASVSFGQFLADSVAA